MSGSRPPTPTGAGETASSFAPTAPRWWRSWAAEPCPTVGHCPAVDTPRPTRLHVGTGQYVCNVPTGRSSGPTSAHRHYVGEPAVPVRGSRQPFGEVHQ